MPTKDPRHGIEPDAIPTLTRVVIPGQTRQLSLDGVEGPQPEAAEPAITAAEIEEAVDTELAQLSAELQAQISEPTISRDEGPAPALTTERIQALVDDVLARHVASLREELTALLERELGLRRPSGD